MKLQQITTYGCTLMSSFQTQGLVKILNALAYSVQNFSEHYEQGRTGIKMAVLTVI